MCFIIDQPPQPRGLQEFFWADWYVKKTWLPTHFNKKIMPLLPIKLEFWGQIIWGLWRIWMKNDLREPSWFDATLNKSFMGHSISTKLSGQFLPWLKNNYMKFGGCDIPNFTAMPIFQQICLGMQEAHTVFYQCSASTASRLSRIFFRLIHNS